MDISVPSPNAHENSQQALGGQQGVVVLAVSFSGSFLEKVPETEEVLVVSQKTEA